MPDMIKACAIAAELKKTARWRSRGRTAVAVASVVLSAMPLTGPLAALVQEIGARLFDADLEEKFSRLCGIVAELQPDLEKLEEMESRLGAAAMALRGVEDDVRQLIDGVGVTTPKEFLVKTITAHQSFTDVTIRNMRVVVEAHQGGRNFLSGLNTVGDNAHFIATSGGSQSVQGSKFEGAHGTVGMDGLTLGGRISTINDQGGVGVAFGKAGSIGFRKGGSLSFGPPKQSKEEKDT